ncbi:MAG: malate dehydrogenase [Candidatus Omnitrophica bacterium]|nr:malate dehydrogenase [Candidatus Omnitrophota bacterium]MBU1524057.1 malate dehydrogenase [Candidatus Omnitrophota bacterium]
MNTKVSIIGAGHVGATVTLMLAQRELADLVMVDIADGLACGKALDLMEAAPVLGYNCNILGTNFYEDIKDSQIVVVTAGLARKPGMDRLDLLKKNAAIIKDITENIKKYAPQSFILMVTNPVDVMTYYALRLSGFNRQRVFGQAGVLDGARFSSFIAKELNVSAQDVKSLVLGGHGDTMLPLPRYTTVCGVPITELIKEERLNQLIDRTRNAGSEIVSLLKTGSAYYSPAASTAYMVEAVLKDKKSILAASVCLNGEYGLYDVCVGVPVKLGKEGVEEIIELELKPEEKESLHKSATVYKESIKELSI